MQETEKNMKKIAKSSQAGVITVLNNTFAVVANVFWLLLLLLVLILTVAGLQSFGVTLPPILVSFAEKILDVLNSVF